MDQNNENFDENMEQLLTLAKQTLGIIPTATAKDGELQMIIQAGINDMTRAGVDIDTTNHLVMNALMTYVKGNFGISNPIDKEKFMHSYRLFLSDLSLSDGYKKQEAEVTTNE